LRLGFSCLGDYSRERLGIAGKLLGASSPKWQRLEAICEEFLGAHPRGLDAAGSDDATDDPSSTMLDRLPSGGALDETKAFLEEETRRWSFLDAFEPVAAPVELLGCAPLVDVTRLDGDLRRLCALRARWDELFGHLALLLRQLGLWRDLQFAGFGHYCAERLEMSERAVSQRASLERRLHELPALRAALRDGRLTYEKARIVAACADDDSLAGWIERAEQLPCIALAREAEGAEEAQTCARDEVGLRLPSRVASLLDSALRAAQSDAERSLTPAECVERIADHFIATWRPLLAERNTVQERVLARDRELCQVPGCSRPAVQVHHVTFRSHGGGDDPSKLIGICAAHHLHAVHVGWVRVFGKAPHRLRWRFRAGGGPARASMAARETV
jgi:5-methylcytosine-specific restriction endonuclease McrA